MQRASMRFSKIPCQLVPKSVIGIGGGITYRGGTNGSWFHIVVFGSVGCDVGKAFFAFVNSTFCPTISTFHNFSFKTALPLVTVHSQSIEHIHNPLRDNKSEYEHPDC